MTTQPHGTVARYRYGKCDCILCVLAKKRDGRLSRERAKAREAERRAAIPSEPQPQPTPDAWASWPFDIQAAIDRAADAQFSGGVPDPRRSSRSTY